MRHFFSFFLLFTTAWQLTYSQVSPAEPAVVEFKFSAYGLARESGIFFQPAPERAPVELALYSSQRSPLYSYKGPLPLVFFRQTAEGGRSPVASLTSVPMPPTGSNPRFLVLLFPASTGEAQLSAVAFPDDLSRLPPGKFNVLNASGKQLQAMIGAQQVTLERGLSQAFPVPPAETPVQIAAPVRGTMALVNTVLVEFSGSARGTLILTPSRNPDRARLRTKLLVEDVDPVKPPAPSAGP
jgi:hypothetical protein